MSVSAVVLNVADVARSVDFYTSHLGAQVVGDPSADHAVLDLVTATVELTRVEEDAPKSTWVPDDLQRGFRHVGFKVDHVDPFVERLKAAGVPFHLEPIEAEGDVRITFFGDPDGTLLELVERDLQYTRVMDEAGVAAERALGAPDRPRLDHVAVTVADLGATTAHYAPLGFTLIGTIAQPHDERGFDIFYLRSGDTVLEVFTYRTPTRQRAPQLAARGYVATVLRGSPADGAGSSVVGEWGGRKVYTDADGFTTAAA